MKSKFLRGFSYTLIIISLLILSFGLQLSIVANQTILSSDFSYNVFDTSNAKSDLTNFILEKIEDKKSIKIDANTRKEVEGIIGASSKGIFSFVVGDKKALPVIDVTNHREQIKEIFSSSIRNSIDEEKFKLDIEQTMKYIENNPDSIFEALTSLADSQKKLKISKESIKVITTEIIKNKFLKMKNNPDKVLDLIVQEKVNEVIGKGNIGIKIDLKKKSIKLTTETVEEPKNLSVLKNVKKLSNIILFVLLVVLFFVGLQFFERRRFLKVFSISLFVLVLLEIVIALIIRLITGAAYSFSNEHIHASVVDFVDKLLQGFLYQHIIISVIFILVAITLFILSFYVKQGVGIYSNMEKVNGFRLVSVLVSVVFVVGCYFAFKSIAGIIHTIICIKDTASAINIDEILKFYVQ